MTEENLQPQVSRQFTVWFCLLFVFLGSLVFVFKRTDLFPWIGACHAGGYDSEHFMAYCHNTRYGDYEHYALYNGSETEAIAAMQQADVLFLGNSNTQYAFSTQATRMFFDESKLKHYVLGFGNGAMSPVAEAVIKKHELRPKVLVVNADPFFSTETNGTFQVLLDAGDSNAVQYQRKKQLQLWQADVCSNEESAWFRWLCHGRSETLYRNRNNGHWVTDYYRENLNIPTSESSDALWSDLDIAQRVAGDFLASVGIEPECVIVTVSPRTGTPKRFAEALAVALGAVGVFPGLEDIQTIDNSHLSPSSAERWSEAVLQKSKATLAKCSNPAWAESGL